MLWAEWAGSSLLCPVTCCRAGERLEGPLVVDECLPVGFELGQGAGTLGGCLLPVLVPVFSGV